MGNTRQLLEESGLIKVKSATPQWTSLEVAPTLESKQQVHEYLRTQLEGLTGELCEGILLAVDELLGNAIEHGCRLDPKGTVVITLVRTDHMILLHVRDDGAGFPVSSMPHAAISNPPEDPLRHLALRSELGMRPGGFGIMLVKQIGDELIYNEAGNEVMMVKFLNQPPDGAHA
ncbi:MAG: ATP-binding protein [Acidobacteriaceae bacterium]|nr:ATP-binding protein [Acidobacteriaceae bacterium]